MRPWVGGYSPGVGYVPHIWLVGALASLGVAALTLGLGLRLGLLMQTVVQQAVRDLLTLGFAAMAILACAAQELGRVAAWSTGQRELGQLLGALWFVGSLAWAGANVWMGRPLLQLGLPVDLAFASGSGALGAGAAARWRRRHDKR